MEQFRYKSPSIDGVQRPNGSPISHDGAAFITEVKRLGGHVAVLHGTNYMYLIEFDDGMARPRIVGIIQPGDWVIFEEGREVRVFDEERLNELFVITS